MEKKPKFKIGDSIRTADTKKFLSKGDTSNCSHKLYTITEIKDGRQPADPPNYLPER